MQITEDVKKYHNKLVDTLTQTYQQEDSLNVYFFSPENQEATPLTEDQEVIARLGLQMAIAIIQQELNALEGNEYQPIKVPS